MAIKGKVIKIGRAEDNHIVCAHQTVNKYHAELFVDADGNVFLTDLSSMNGSFVNGKRAYEPVLLKEGDVLKIAGNITIDWQRVLPKKPKVEPEVEKPITQPKPKEPIGQTKPSFESEKPSNKKNTSRNFSITDFIKNYWDVFAIYAGILLMLLIIRLYIG
ncbi:MAG: FHA domain-containing protein [Crocinitomicaceae bacterium]